MSTTGEKFQSLLKGYLCAKKIRQQAVAKELGLTSSAVSQMLSGKKMLFQMHHLNRICEMLALEPAQTFELQSLLLRLRNAGEFATTPFARMLFALRIARGVSYCELANLTGISAATLQRLEKDDSASLSPEIAEKLAPVLNCRAELLLSAADLTMNTSFYSMLHAFSPLTAAEPEPTFSSGKVIPEVPLDAMRDFTQDKDLNSFLFRHALQHVATNEPDGIAAILGCARDFGLAGKLPLCVLLAKKKTAASGMELVSTNRGFSLITPAPREHMVQLFTETPLHYLHLNWRLPVTKIIAASSAESTKNGKK